VSAPRRSRTAFLVEAGNALPHAGMALLHHFIKKNGVMKCII
jgi:cytochrome b561